MTRVPEHDGEQEGEGGDGEDGGVHLPVAVHAVGVHQALHSMAGGVMECMLAAAHLVAGGVLVGAVEGGVLLRGGDLLHGRHYRGPGVLPRHLQGTLHARDVVGGQPTLPYDWQCMSCNEH